MFLYLGDGRYKRKSDIIGIFDMDSATVCASTRKFLSTKEREKRVESDGELPKSFILCEENKERSSVKGRKRKSREKQKNEYSVFLSRLSSQVLFARTKGIKESLTEEE